MEQPALDRFYVNHILGRMLPLTMVAGIGGFALFTGIMLLVNDVVVSRESLVLVGTTIVGTGLAWACSNFARKSSVNGVIATTLSFSLVSALAIAYHPTVASRGQASVLYLAMIVLLVNSIASPRYWVVIAGWMVVIGPVAAFVFQNNGRNAAIAQLLGFLLTALISTTILYVVLRRVKWAYFRLYVESSERLNTDPLTALYNRVAWISLVQGWINAPTTTAGRVATVLYMDLDNMKMVNDEHGHQAGDRMLMSFADALRCVMPGNATIARFGGDEFVAFLPDTTPEQAAPMVQALRQQAYRKSEQMGMTLGIGVAAYVVPEPIDSAVHRADRALIIEKNERRAQSKAARAMTTADMSAMVTEGD